MASGFEMIVRSMQNAAPMRCVECARDVNRARKRLIERQRPVLKPRGQRFAFEIVEHEKVDVTVVPDVVERADVRMTGARRSVASQGRELYFSS